MKRYIEGCYECQFEELKITFDPDKKFEDQKIRRTCRHPEHFMSGAEKYRPLHKCVIEKEYKNKTCPKFCPLTKEDYVLSIKRKGE